MELNWLQSILLGLVTGFAEILPVSAEAHRLVFLKLFGVNSEPALLRLILHLSTLAALYYCCRGQIVRMTRAKKLAQVPKRRRKRPLDTRSLMDFSLLKTTLIPIVIAFLFYHKTVTLGSNMLIVAGFLFLNGVILYIPQFLPGSNKDSRSLTRLEGLLMGFGGAISTLPGISCVGAATSIGGVCGMDKNYTLSTALIMNIPVTIGLIIYDVIGMMDAGIVGVSFVGLVGYLMAAVVAFAGVLIAIRLLKKLLESESMSVFAVYCWGAALFAFILYLAV